MAKKIHNTDTGVGYDTIQEAIDVALDGWGTGWENISTGEPLAPAEGEQYFIAGNNFLGNEHGSGLDYTEGAHLYFQD